MCSRAADAPLQAQLALPGAPTGADAQARWDALHEDGSDVVASTIADLRGFYVKSGQLIGSRADLFPAPYCRKLQPLQDSVPPMDGALLVRVVETELLGGRPLSSVFSAFDAAPLGSASVAQVHRAVLRDTGEVVAVKVQRPAMQPLMLGDVANIKALAKQLRGRFPTDYYTVFSELEAQLAFEFDFEHEARSMTRIADVLDALPGGAPVRVPRPKPGLIARRVLVMDYIPGVPLTRLAAELAARGITPGSLAAKLAAQKLLRGLTDAFGAMLLGDGFFHGDPHPGNIMVDGKGDVALIDFGQVKQLSEPTRLGLARIMLLLDACGGGADAGCAADCTPFAKAVTDLGVVFKPEVPDATLAAAALAFWLFDSTATVLPGGYDANELSAKSPVAEVASFPQELVFVGRSTVLIRGLAARLGVTWSLAREWAPQARAALAPPGEKAAPEPARRGGLLVRIVLAIAAAAARWLAALRDVLLAPWRLLFGQKGTKADKAAAAAAAA